MLTNIISRNDCKGFTLVELIVATSILAMIGMLGIQFNYQSRKVAPSVTNKLFLQMDSQNFSSRITGELRKASEVITPELGRTTPFILYVDIKNHMRFLYLTDNNKDTEEIGKTVYDLMLFQYGYSSTKSKLTKIASRISKISFSLLSPSSVQISAIVCDKKHSVELFSHARLIDLEEYK